MLCQVGRRAGFSSLVTTAMDGASCGVGKAMDGAHCGVGKETLSFHASLGGSGPGSRAPRKTGALHLILFPAAKLLEMCRRHLGFHQLPP